ncbi:MAG TPA: FAD-dependent oxidoreductase [Chthoniobacterales bacterium]|nr:FAD-dependent oxidoreductase [Chthoniobacterales bacterium]
MEFVDYLVVGQGLAGSLLTLLLQERGLSVIVVENGHRHAASKAAGGIINPITGKRLNRPALIDKLLKRVFTVYPKIEAQLAVPLFQERTVLRLLQSDEEAQRWRRQSSLSEYRDYLSSIPPRPFPLFRNKFGVFEVIKAAQLDIRCLILRARECLLAQQSLINRPFGYDDLNILPDRIRWKRFTARCAIFCEGYRMARNPYFSELKLNPAKGETLTIATSNFAEDRIVQHGKWIFRNVAGEILAGTNYQWDRLDEEPTEAARKEIESAVREFFVPDFEITDHRAGIRPVTRVDNRPVVGVHPRWPQLAILNGLGSKGALQAPLAAQELVSALEEGKPILKEIDVCRPSLWNSVRRN